MYTKECYEYNTLWANLFYLFVVGPLFVLWIYHKAVPIIRAAYPLPQNFKLKRFPVIDGTLLVTHGVLAVYLVWSRYHMQNLITLTLPCHVTLAVTTLFLTPLQDHPALHLLWGGLKVQFAGGGLLGILFRDRATWGVWMPPYYNEMFYFQHIVVFLVPHYIEYAKFGLVGRPFQHPYSPVRYILLASVPMWVVFNIWWWLPLSMVSGVNCHYLLCPLSGLKIDDRFPWMPHALWPFLWPAVTSVCGWLWFYGIESPINMAVAVYLFRVKPADDVVKGKAD